MKNSSSSGVRRRAGAADCIWAGEVFQAGRWYTLWTTCRLTRRECAEALKEHAALIQYPQARHRVVKWARGGRG